MQDNTQNKTNIIAMGDKIIKFNMRKVKAKDTFEDSKEFIQIA